MNTFHRFALVGIVASGLVACASGQEKTTYVPPSHVGDYVVDGVYVSNVEHAARSQGIQVTWVNVPVKRVSKADEQ